MRTIAVVVCVCVAATGTGCVSAEQVARERHGRVHPGLSQADVEGRLGPPTTTATEHDVAVWTYVYHDEVSPVLKVLYVLLVILWFAAMAAGGSGGGSSGGSGGGPPHQFQVGFGASGRVAWVGCVHPVRR
jgi:outer membrane protein assembly factor BamE (lipoprotein component of BamABCDE complex)